MGFTPSSINDISVINLPEAALEKFPDSTDLKAAMERIGPVFS